MKNNHLMAALGLAICLSVQTAIAAPADLGFDYYKRGEYAEALKIWRPLAERGDAVAQFFLGSMYAKGTGVPQDYAEAIKWLRKAADQGDVYAQNNLAFTYDLMNEHAEALKWYRLAAEKGNATAQNNLGVMYFEGRGVPQDNVLAHMWFNLAVSGGSVEAAQGRDDAAALMTSDQIAEAQKMAREWLAAHSK